MKKQFIIFLVLILCLLNINIIYAETDIDTYTTNDYVYEYYIDTYGNTIKRNTRTYIGDVNSYEKAAPNIDGYVCINTRINKKNLTYTPGSLNFKSTLYANLYKFNTDGDYVLFIYAEDDLNSGYPDDSRTSQDVTVIYYDNVTSRKIETRKYSADIGSNYKFSPSTNETFDNTKYRFVSSSPKSNDKDDVEIFVSRNDADNIISLYYTRGSTTTNYLTIYHYDVDTNKLIDEEIISNVKIGSNFSYTIKTIGGYNFISSTPSKSNFGTSISIDITNNNKDNVIYCYYKKSAIDTTTDTWFDNNNQYYVSPSDTYYSSYNYNETLISSKGIGVNTLPYYNIANGYSDNNFKPNKSLTRAEAAQMFYNIATNKNTGILNTYYKDLNTSDWFYTPIYYLTSNGIMNGYADNTIKPNSNITRAEFIKLATTIAGYDSLNTSKIYTDVTPNDWFYNSVRAGSQLNLINGYEDNTFKPNNNITRAEAIKIIDTIAGRTLDFENIYSDVYFNDVNPSDWFYPYVKMSIGNSK